MLGGRDQRFTMHSSLRPAVVPSASTHGVPLSGQDRHRLAHAWCWVDVGRSWRQLAVCRRPAGGTLALCICPPKLVCLLFALLFPLIPLPHGLLLTGSITDARSLLRKKHQPGWRPRRSSSGLSSSHAYLQFHGSSFPRFPITIHHTTWMYGRPPLGL